MSCTKCRPQLASARPQTHHDEGDHGGIDELGVLLAGHAKNAYWFGSQLSIAEAGVWRLITARPACNHVGRARRHDLNGEPAARRPLEPDNMDRSGRLRFEAPIGSVVGKYGLDAPLYQRGELFAEDLDTSILAVQEHSGGVSA
jgi:homospermidine synthase